MQAKESRTVWFALMLGHVAGMLDLIILPLWVSGLMTGFGFGAASVGSLVTLYLAGTLCANALLARRFDSLPPRVVAGTGFVVAALAFIMMTEVKSWDEASHYSLLAILNFVAGAGAGAGLATIHGLIGRSINPHRLFAFVNFGISIWAIVFFGATPGLMARFGVNGLFAIVAGMFIAAVAAMLFGLPRRVPEKRQLQSDRAGTTAPPVVLALCFAGVVFLQAGQAMTNSFVERIGNYRGFTSSQIEWVLIAASVLVLISPLIAGLLQNKLAPLTVAIGGLLFHGCLCATVSTSTSFVPYAIATSMMVMTVVFVHTFVFGLLAALEPSGRTNAATPSMLMIGTAVGPSVGGFMAQAFGFSSIGFAAFVSACLGAACFFLVRRKLAHQTTATVAV